MTMVSGTILTHEPAPIQTEDHMQIGEADVVDNLIKGPLKKGGIYGHDGYESLRGESGRKGHGMLLCNAHVEEALRVGLGKFIETCSLRHGRGDGK